jgi:hypothetical protein
LRRKRESLLGLGPSILKGVPWSQLFLAWTPRVRVGGRGGPPTQPHPTARMGLLELPIVNAGRVDPIVVGGRNGILRQQLPPPDSPFLDFSSACSYGVTFADPCREPAQVYGAAASGGYLQDSSSACDRRARPRDWLPCDWIRPFTKEATSKAPPVSPWDWPPCDWLSPITREATSKTHPLRQPPAYYHGLFFPPSAVTSGFLGPPPSWQHRHLRNLPRGHGGWLEQPRYLQDQVELEGQTGRGGNQRELGPPFNCLPWLDSALLGPRG